MAHCLIILTLNEEDTIDRIVSAELSNYQDDPDSYQKVINHMIHGPCVLLNNQSQCMNEGYYSKKYPKDFAQETRNNTNGYPIFKKSYR